MAKKRDLFAFFVLISSFFSIHAQIGINTESPDPSSYLDVQGKAGGVLFPRLTTTQRDAIVKPARGLVIFNDTKSLIEQNIGTADAPIWGTYNTASGSKAPEWFYMPVTPIDVTLADNLYTKDLFKEYTRQFNQATLPTGTAVANIPKVYTAAELEFLVLGYDKSVFTNVAISNVGVLQYKANPANVSDSTYFNVIFKIK